MENREREMVAALADASMEGLHQLFLFLAEDTPVPPEIVMGMDPATPTPQHLCLGTPTPKASRSSSSLMGSPQRPATPALARVRFSTSMSTFTSPAVPEPSAASLESKVRFMLSDAEAMQRAAISAKANAERWYLQSQKAFIATWEAALRQTIWDQEAMEMHHIQGHDGDMERIVEEVSRCASRQQLRESMRVLHSTWEQSRAQEELLEGMDRSIYRATERAARSQLEGCLERLQALGAAADRERALLIEFEHDAWIALCS